MLFAGALLAVAALSAGCGGGGDDPTEAATAPEKSKGPLRAPVKTNSLTKAQYLARAGGVCDDSWKSMMEGFEQGYPHAAHAYRSEQTQSKGEGKEFQSASRHIFLPGFQFQYDDIEYVGAPKGDEREVGRMLGALQEAVFAGWKQRIRSAKQLAEIFYDFNELAYHYGLNSCLVYESDFRGIPE